VELMMGLLVSGLLCTAIWELLRAQGRSLAYETQRQEAQDNGRAALDVISGDLRSALPQAVIGAGENALELALPKAWGVVCNDAATPQQLDAVFPALANDAFTILAHGGTGLMADTSGGAVPRLAPAPTLGPGRAQVNSAEAIGPQQAGNACAGAGEAGRVSVLHLGGVNFPVVPRGRLVMLYQLVRYDSGLSEGRWWVRRSNGMAGSASFSMTPLAGPLAARDSLRFAYFGGAAGAPLQTLGDDRARLDSIGAIAVKLVTASVGRYAGLATRSHDSALVLPRNRMLAPPCAADTSSAC
jgi:hypothetical protein